MSDFLLKTISVIMWLWFLLSSIILSPFLVVLWLLTVLWDRKLRVLHQFSCFWGAQYIWMNPLWKLKIYGRKNFKRNGKYVVISNHQSLADIVVIYSLFRHFRWTSKKENFKLPFVGWVLSFNRSIKIYRKDIDAFEKFRTHAVKELQSGNSIMVFPEGTRSKNGLLGRFREGAFKIAMETGADILPMVLDGTSRAIPKKGWSLTGREKMILKVLEPIPFEEYKDRKARDVMKLVHGIIARELDAIRIADAD